MGYVLACDLGTTNLKLALYSIGSTILQAARGRIAIPLHVLNSDMIEQDADDWWSSLVAGTRAMLERSGIPGEEINSISICSQCTCVVTVDRDGECVRRPFSWLDHRASEQRRKGISTGLQVSGANVHKLLTALHHTGGAALSGRDMIWEYHWIRENEPENFARISRFIDTKDYILRKLTGSYLTTQDDAFMYFLADKPAGFSRFSAKACALYGVDPEHLPGVIRAADVAGPLIPEAAQAMGLKAGIPVFGGGIDTTMTALGAGSHKEGDTGISFGTSAMLTRVMSRHKVDPIGMMSGIPAPMDGSFFYAAELGSAGKCYEWALNQIGLPDMSFEELDQALASVPPGCNGVIFAPWFSGISSPLENPDAKGMLINVGLDTTRNTILRAMAEGISFQIRWALERMDKIVGVPDTVRLFGGAASSESTCQLLADNLNRTVLVPKDPDYTGCMGAAIAAGVGLGLIPGYDAIDDMIPIRAAYKPRPEFTNVYDRNYKAFRELYRINGKHFKNL